MELEVADVQAGDVLLCFSNMTANEAQAAETGYSHAAIALAEQRAFEASNTGVCVLPLAKLLGDYDHIAVLRSADLWIQSRLQLLENFAAHASGKSFNQVGLIRFLRRKEQYQADLMERVKGYFDGTEAEVASERPTYFCSELVTAAFIHVGIIDKSAANVFTPETFSPSDIARDKAFGFFCGYLKSTPTYVVPETDYFKSNV
ncbi:MAG TPA: hypothetical protein VHC91_02070 [Trinickia sp.]|uniref:hypothetical protein n=1 Tax=Trinickia sp. TaxID=2571163 RepID=UPI002B9FE343|nr:hypothetical protein [Trinickia sp.]HVW49177.1 hypothetical protein [Trinickia sp.]